MFTVGSENERTGYYSLSDKEYSSEKQIIGDDCCKTWWKWWDWWTPDQDASQDPGCRNRFAEALNVSDICNNPTPPGARALARRYGEELSKNQDGKYPNLEAAFDAYIVGQCSNVKKLASWNEDYWWRSKGACKAVGYSDKQCDFTIKENTERYIALGEKYCLDKPMDANQCIAPLENDKFLNDLWHNGAQKNMTAWQKWDLWENGRRGLCYQPGAVPCYKLQRPWADEGVWNKARAIKQYENQVNVAEDLFQVAEENACTQGAACDQYTKCANAVFERFVKGNPYYNERPYDGRILAFNFCQAVGQGKCPEKNNAADCYEDGKIVLTPDVIHMAKEVGVKFDGTDDNAGAYQDLEYLYLLTDKEKIEVDGPEANALMQFIQQRTTPEGYDWRTLWGQYAVDQIGSKTPFSTGGMDSSGNIVNGIYDQNYGRGIAIWLVSVYDTLRLVLRGKRVDPTKAGYNPATDWRCWWSDRRDPNYFSNARKVRKLMWGNSGDPCADLSRDMPECQSDDLTEPEKNWCTTAEIAYGDCKSEVRKRFGCDYLDLEDDLCKRIGVDEGMGKACYDAQVEKGFNLKCTQVAEYVGDESCYAPKSPWDYLPYILGGGGVIFGGLILWKMYG